MKKNKKIKKYLRSLNVKLTAATSRFAHLKNFLLNFSSSSFVIRVNLVHP